MGCSRSGTTLLQSLLASHSEVHTFPETGVFLKAFGMRGRVLPWARIGLSIGKERKALAMLLPSQGGTPGHLPNLPPFRLSLSRSLAGVAGFLDGLAEANGKRAWVEKTPRHVLHARRIGRAVPGAVCVHIIRRGQDVVASIVDRAKRYPDRFPRQADPSYGIRQWNRSIKATADALQDPGHAVVVYESLVTTVEPTMRALCTTFNLDFEPGMITPGDSSAFTHVSEGWKSRVKEPVEKARSKFGILFNEETRERIENRLERGLYLDLTQRASEAHGGVLLSSALRRRNNR